MSGYDLNEPCWGCGSIGEHPEFGGHYWPCGTMKVSSIRGEACYETEIAAKDALLREAVETVKAPTHEVNDFNCQDWPPGQGCRGCDGDELRKTFLARSEIKALMKEVE